MKKLVLLCLFIASSMFSQQNVVIKDRTITGNEPAVQATDSIIIKPTTWIKAGATFHAYITDYINTPYELPNLSATENYVFTRVYQKPMTTAVRDLANLQGLYVKDFTESISYFDGLGRAKQSIAIQQSQTKGDIVTHIAYDNLGRQNEEYLPYAITSNNGGVISGDVALATQNYYKAKYSADFANVNLPINAYSKKEFDNSPLNRVLKQAAPGQSWRLDGGHEIEFDYQSNTATEVRQYYVTTSFSNNTYTPELQLNTSVSANNGYYKANELYKTITKDENHTGVNKIHTTEEFKNKQGQVVLKRTYITNTITADTYYVYDDFGNLTYVLPPKSEAQLAKPNATSLSELCYQYKYDHRNRLVEKKIPGKGIESIVYDKLDRPVLTQDKIQQASRKWLFTKYDILGRVVYTGVYTHATAINRETMQTYFNNQNLQNTVNAASKMYEEQLTVPGALEMYYSNANFPNTNSEVLTVNYYDNYVFYKLGVSENSYGIPFTSNIKGLATGSRVKVLETNSWITTITYYDEKARPIYVFSINDFLNTIDIVERKLDAFTGKILETKTTHKKVEKDDIITVDRFEYDHANRLLKQIQKINNQEEQVLAENTYDELGQLKNKGVGGRITQNRLQTVDYTYNVRGWLKNINQDGLDDKDLFNFTINYNNPTSTGTALFNGNISQTSWNTLSADKSAKMYNYRYDALNRITGATGVLGDKYDVSGIQYDKNGNIRNLQRKGHTQVDNQGNITDFGLMDNLKYTYANNNTSNQLIKVEELTDGSKTFGFKDGVNTAKEYFYDVNGNMTKDLNKGISNITYNHLNLPLEVKFNNSNTKKINYVYDASGVKLRKTVNDSGAITTTEYAGSYVYEDGMLQFFNHAEGYVSPKNASDITQGFKYVYQYKDHLGNVRLSYTDNNNSGKIEAASEIIEESNYYPFGLKHKGYNNVMNHGIGNGVAQKFGYNGKELNEELGLEWHDFGARNYDASLGRWMNLDPLAEQYYDISSYVYALNAPTFFIDPDGREVDVSDLWNQIKDGQKGKEADKARWVLAQLIVGLGKTSGKEINISSNVKTGNTILTSNGEGNGTEGEAFVNHLLKIDNTEKKSNTIFVGTSDEKGGSSGGGKNVFLQAEQIYGIQEGLEKKGFDRETMSVGMAFLHETLHTEYGANFFNSEEDKKEKYYGKFDDVGVNGGRVVKRINIFRKELGLPQRISYGPPGSFMVSKDGNKKLVKFKWKSLPILIPKNKYEKK